VIVVRPGAGVTLDQVREYLLARGVARYKIPEVLRVAESLPRNSLGKVQRHLLLPSDGTTSA